MHCFAHFWFQTCTSWHLPRCDQIPTTSHEGTFHLDNQATNNEISISQLWYVHLSATGKDGSCTRVSDLPDFSPIGPDIPLFRENGCLGPQHLKHATCTSSNPCLTVKFQEARFSLLCTELRSIRFGEMFIDMIIWLNN